MGNSDAPLRNCPDCGAPLVHVREMEMETRFEGGQFVVPFASQIYQCSNHGQFRVFINGKVERFSEPTE